MCNKYRGGFATWLKKQRRVEKKESGSIIKLSNGKFRSELKYTDAFGNIQVLCDTANTKTEAERNLKRYQKTLSKLEKLGRSQQILEAIFTIQLLNTFAGMDII